MRSVLALCAPLLLLLGCLAEQSTDQNQTVIVETETEGDTSLPLSLGQIRSTANTPGPTLVVFETTLPPEASVQLRLNGNLEQQIESGTQCQVLPAVTVCEDQINRQWPIMFTSGGDYELQLVAEKAAQSRTLTAQFSIPENACMESPQLYQERMQPTLQQQCGSCHIGGNNAASVFSVNDAWSQMANALVNRGETFYQSPSGQNPGHSARPLTPWSEDYRLLAEMVWRAERRFECINQQSAF
ncbi:MAG: hypothetical protein LAT65_03950 [Saccharospirillum sp.]|nr:hypothetical protein [Saccharospirillum sp.]